MHVPRRASFIYFTDRDIAGPPLFLVVVAAAISVEVVVTYSGGRRNVTVSPSTEGAREVEARTGGMNRPGHGINCNSYGITEAVRYV